MSPKEKEKSETLDDIFGSLGIERSKKYALILWNDNHNDMLYVAQSLYDYCNLGPEEATKKMLEAHEKGKAIIKVSDYHTLEPMKNGMDSRDITTTIEEYGEE